MKHTCFRCRERGCGRIFPSLLVLRRHRLDAHPVHQRGGGDDSAVEELSPIMQRLTDPGVLRTYRRHVYAIARRSRVLGRYRSVHNFPIDEQDISIERLMQMVREIFQEQRHPFRLNFSFGLILNHASARDDDDDELQPRYFHAYRNTHVLPTAFRISSNRDLSALKKRLQSLDVFKLISRDREDTKWFLSLVTNVSFDVSVMSVEQPLGCDDLELPEFLKKKRSIRDVAGRGNLCFFRCLAYFKGARGVRKTEEAVERYFSLWIEGGAVGECSTFPGITLCDVPSLEETFELNITIFTLREDGCAETVRASTADYENTLYLNQWENHLMLVTNLEGFSRKYPCGKCSRILREACSRARHSSLCDGKDAESSNRYRGGFFREEPSLSTRLGEAAICVEDEELAYRFFAFFDCECILKDVRKEEDVDACSAKVAQHVCASIAISSNVPGYEEAVCFLEREPAELVRQMLKYLGDVQEQASLLMRDQMSETFAQLGEKLADCQGQGQGQGQEVAQRNKREQTTYLRLLRSVSSHCDVLPILGFNSSAYDLPVLREHLLPQLSIADDPEAYVLKKNSGYLAICTEKFRFLDVHLFLSPGSSYERFLTAYSPDSDERKSFFPYEVATTFEALEERGFPEYSDFYSELKGENTLESNSLRYRKLLSQGLSSEDALRAMDSKTVPLSGPEEYEHLREIWTEQGMERLSDLLIYYNLKDVAPAVGAVQALWTFYQKLGVNILKDCFTVAGVARKVLFKAAREYGAGFSLIHRKDRRLQEEILLQGVTGGPSIVYCRYQEADKTFLHGQSGKMCRSVQGYDCNSMYLGCIGTPMPTGSYIHRTAENHFVPERRDKYLISFVWLDWLSRERGISLTHAQNSGREVTVLGRKVDGYHHETRTVFQFHGCYWHAHFCVDVDPADAKKVEFLRRRRQDTETSDRLFAESNDYNLEVIYECEFLRQMAANPELREFYENWDPTFMVKGKKKKKKKKTKLKQEDVLDAIADGRLFGVAVVAVSVPSTWSGAFSHPVLSPREYFEMFPPVFQNRLVSYDDVGEFMQKCIRKRQLTDKLKKVLAQYQQRCRDQGRGANRRELLRLVAKVRFTKPPARRLLVSLLGSDRLVVTTPLVQWYMAHGLEVTVLEMLQYRAEPCFKSFVDMVTKARQSGSEVQARTMKVC